MPITPRLKLRRSKPTADPHITDRAARRASRTARREEESLEESTQGVDSDLQSSSKTRDRGVHRALKTNQPVEENAAISACDIPNVTTGRAALRTTSNATDRATRRSSRDAFRTEEIAGKSAQEADSDLQTGSQRATIGVSRTQKSKRMSSKRNNNSSRNEMTAKNPTLTESESEDDIPLLAKRLRRRDPQAVAKGDPPLERAAPKRRTSTRKSGPVSTPNSPVADEQELSVDDYVAMLRSRLFSDDSEMPLPGRLAGALHAVEAAVLPALAGSGSGSPVVLLCGARGCGKSTIVARLQSALAASEVPPTVVALHGLLHATPGAAFRAIARALGGSGHGGAQHCLGEIAASVATLRESRTPLLFVLDEFHRFVHAANSVGQTTLYAIFNLLQDSALHGAAVCVTPHIDVSDHLEKRVKSRFCHRVVYVPMPTTADETLQFVRDALIVPDSAPKRARAVVRAFLGSTGVKNAVCRQFQRDRAAGPVLAAVDVSLLSALALSDAAASAKEVVRNAENAFLNALERWGSARDFIWGLATLELALLLALTRLETRDARGMFLFDDVFREYQTLATGGQESMLRTQLAHVESRPLAAKAWERVVEAGLVARASGAAGVRKVELAVAPDVVRDALKVHPAATTLMQRWGAGGVVQ